MLVTGCSSRKTCMALISAIDLNNKALTDVIEVSRQTAFELQSLKAELAAKENNENKAAEAIVSVVKEYELTETAEIKIEESKQYLEKARQLAKPKIEKILQWIKLTTNSLANQVALRIKTEQPSTNINFIYAQQNPKEINEYSQIRVNKNTEDFCIIKMPVLEENNDVNSCKINIYENFFNQYYYSEKQIISLYTNKIKETFELKILNIPIRNYFWQVVFPLLI